MDGGAFNYTEREILFRGRRIDNDEWIDVALLCLDDGETRIATSCLAGDVPNLFNVCAQEVDPETVGQYIGLTGAWICEGDIVKGKVHMLGGYRVRTGGDRILYRRFQDEGWQRQQRDPISMRDCWKCL